MPFLSVMGMICPSSLFIGVNRLGYVMLTNRVADAAWSVLAYS